MAYLKLYILLSVLTTAALLKIHANNGLKYHKILFGKSEGRKSLNQFIFLPQHMLSKSMFLQEYRNWLTIIDMISLLEVVVGWYEHHSRMLQDQKNSGSFKAW